MIIFKNIEIEKFRNLSHAKLESLKDLNILIGPNNCGKTNFLEFIARMKELIFGGSYGYLCKPCQKFKQEVPDLAGVSLSLDAKDFYLNDTYNEMTVTFLLDEKQIDRFVPGVLEKQRKKLEFNPGRRTNPCESVKDEIVMVSEKPHTTLYGKHLSPFIHEGILQEIKGSILYCPEGRLQSYKEKGFVEYIREQRFSIAQKRKWIDFLQRIVDPKIDDERYENLIRKVNGEDFETEISKQGSGVRSLVCLGVDILFGHNRKIVLIDEPELGLNPFVKQEFLKFLLDESKERQIFIATQDPTFVNPVLWKNNSVAVYFYSVANEEFVKIDLKQNQEDPTVFAGYLPHTVSLKDIHIYVEGTSDAYILQILLEKHLKETFPENWLQILNKVGIFHLCGDFWKHLLYTIPKHPYKCIVILDGDKRNEIEAIIERYTESKVNTSRFVLCEDTKNLKNAFKGENHPIYCLKEDCIEKYLFPEFDCSNISLAYNKRRDGPRKAKELQEIPEEIKEIFTAIFQ